MNLLLLGEVSVGACLIRSAEEPPVLSKALAHRLVGCHTQSLVRKKAPGNRLLNLQAGSDISEKFVLIHRLILAADTARRSFPFVLSWGRGSEAMRHFSKRQPRQQVSQAYTTCLCGVLHLLELRV